MIKNLLFDLGGVIMDIRRDNCVQAFRELGMTNPDDFLGEYVQAGPFEGIENGSMSIDQFHDAIRKIMGNTSLSDTQIDIAFGKFLLGIPPHRLEQLRELHSHYKLYLLSNTNPIMWRDGIARAFAAEGHDANYYFDGIVKSYEARLLKPAPEIFHYAEQVLGIDPDETLFLDDSQRNLDVARSLGFKTLLVEPRQEFFSLLKNYPGIHV